MPNNTPYLALLDIKAIIRRWQDLEMPDSVALACIAGILKAERQSR